jgi:long-subunit acyl-CoA synthetase (AMP-forming)
MALGSKAHRSSIIDDPLRRAWPALIGEAEYEAFMPRAIRTMTWKKPDDEWDAISLNYTSGTTGNPKGVSTTIAAPICWARATC